MKFWGIHDRFEPGKAWYHNLTTAGQLGYAQNPAPQA